MGTFPLFLATSLNFIFSLTPGWSFEPIMFLVIFQLFCYWHFDFSIVKAPLAFVCYTSWILGLKLSRNNKFWRSQGEIWHFLAFLALNDPRVKINWEVAFKEFNESKTCRNIKGKRKIRLIFLVHVSFGFLFIIY